MTTDITTNALAQQRAVTAPTPRKREATAPTTLTVTVDQASGMGRDTNRLRKGSVLDSILGREF